MASPCQCFAAFFIDLTCFANRINTLRTSSSSLRPTDCPVYVCLLVVLQADDGGLKGTDTIQNLFLKVLDLNLRQENGYERREMIAKKRSYLFRWKN